MVCKLYLVVVFLHIDALVSTRDVSDLELEFLSHHLKDHECRQLVEALHSPELFLTEITDGSQTDRNLSCIQLLKSWNGRESRGESFVRLTGRLRELNFSNLSAQVSRAVFKELEDNIQMSILERKGKDGVTEEEEVIKINSSPTRLDMKESHISDFDGRPEEWPLPDWTTGQTVLFAISSLLTVGLFGFWFIHCIPDCCSSLKAVCTRSPIRSREDAAQFLLNEIDENDA